VISLLNEPINNTPKMKPGGIGGTQPGEDFIMNCIVRVTPPSVDGNKTVESNFVESSFTQDDLAVRDYASLVSVVEAAPVENKLGVFWLMARSGAADAAAFRQNTIDSLWHVADGTGLVQLIGTAVVQNTLVNAFAGADAA
jgi:hypothetical protein